MATKGARTHNLLRTEIFTNRSFLLVLGIVLFFLVSVSIFFITRGATPHNSELLFVEHSVLGTSAGSVVPASCNSDPHFAVECLSASLVVNPTALPYGGSYTSLTLTSAGAISCTMFSRYAQNTVWDNQGAVAVNGTWGPSVPLYKDMSYQVSCLDQLGGTILTNIATVTVAPNVQLQTTTQGGGYPWARINGMAASTYLVPEYDSVTISWDAIGTCVGSSNPNIPAWNGPKVSVDSQLISNPTTYSTTRSATAYVFTLTCNVGSSVASRPFQVSFANDYNPPSGCFVSGTKVRMGDGVLRDIETVSDGEMIMTSAGPSRINKVFRIPFKGDLYAFNGSGNYFVTATHPFRTPEGWKSFDPAGSRIENPGLEVSELQIGDQLLREDGSITVLNSVDKKYAEVMVYNFRVDGMRDFYADGYWVHNAISKIPL